MVAIWVKKALKTEAPHNHAGHHELELVEHTGPVYATFPTTVRFSDLYCQPPTTIDLYAGEEPPPP